MKINFRRQLLINKSFQISFIMWFLLLSAITSIIFYAAILTFFRQMTTEAIILGLPENHIIFSFLNEQKQDMNKIFIYASIFSTISIVSIGLIITNKVAGPIYRLTQHLLEKKTGHIAFRQGDYFSELRDAFNKYTDDK
jgi:hypothetical protein